MFDGRPPPGDASGGGPRLTLVAGEATKGIEAAARVVGSTSRARGDGKAKLAVHRDPILE